MSKKRNRDNMRLEPKLGAAVIEDTDQGLRVDEPIKVKTKKAKPEEPVQKQDMEIKRHVIVLASFLLLISTVIFAVDQLFSPDSFEIEELRISADLEHITPQEIRQQILPLIQNNYFAVDLKKVEQTVEAIDWVDQVSVRRQWPKSIHVRLTEHKPVAYWGDSGYLNHRAESFNVREPMKISTLPYLHGPQGTQKTIFNQYKKWKKLLSRRQLDLESLVMTPRYAYEAKVKISKDQQKQLTQAALIAIYEDKKQPIPVIDWHRIKPFYLTLQLGKNDMETRLDRFVNAYPQAFNDQVLKVKSIDLRYPNGFAVRWNEDDLPQEFLQLAVSIDEEN